MKFKLVVLLMAVCLAGCGQDMKNNGRTKPYQEDPFFKNKSSARPLMPGVVARGHLKYPTPFFTGRQNGQYVKHIPMAVNRALLERGEDRYNIYCAVCHDALGEGNGMIIQRGFPKTASLHIERLRQAPDGYFFDVITNGKGTMASDSDVLDEKDRWAIVAYIRALQRSQHSSLSDAPPKVQDKLKSGMDTVYE